MRIRQHATLGLAATACLVLSGCTNAADWNANRSSQIHSYDTSSIQAQPDIIATLPQGALDDGVLDVAASTDYAPAEFLDPSGKAVGYDVDLLSYDPGDELPEPNDFLKSGNVSGGNDGDAVRDPVARQGNQGAVSGGFNQGDTEDED